MEATDMARHQQVSLVIRYVDDEFNVYECFKDFGRASDTTDEMDIAEAVVHVRDSSDAVKCLYNLTEASTKCHKMFEDLQKKVGVVSVPLKQSFDTRWICRYERVITCLRYRQKTGQNKKLKIYVLNARPVEEIVIEKPSDESAQSYQTNSRMALANQ
ncbi:unnamed protein product [Rotaria sordida]|uniref:Uncharacterized protein n=1 Tax=Rotaria sordida TaxID=392033 RepID=A0A814ZCK7_9BILA|nr:unnamed protein product [Rotaria sordida]